MNILYLGTGSAEGIPALFCQCETCLRAYSQGGVNHRSRQQVLINGHLLIDFSPDSHSHRLSYSQINSVFFTHSHSDHLYCEDLSLLKEVTRKMPLTLFGNEKVAAILAEHHLSCHSLIAFNPVCFQTDYCITPLKANHSQKENALMLLIQHKQTTFLYAHDTGLFPDSTWDYLQEKQIHLDVVSLDCTYQTQASSSSHMNIEQNYQIKQKMLAFGLVKKQTPFILSHFSHLGGMLHHELVDYVRKDFHVAYDSMQISI